MESIILSIDIEKPQSEVYEMISTLGGLRSWLTRDTTGTPKKGGTLRLGFGPEHHTDFEVRSMRPSSSLSWTLLASSFSHTGTGVGTVVAFSIKEAAGRGTRITLTHAGWESIDEFFRISGYQWEKALESLKKVCETGFGDPLTPKMLVSRKASGWFPVA